MTYRIMPRTEAGLPAAVTSSSGQSRQPLMNERWMTAHYTGNNIDYTGKDAAAVTRQIQAVFSSTKPFEYNYVIGQNEDNIIVEYAGKFQAAHSAGENADSFGVLFLLGVGEDPTPTMIDKWRWLRDVLIFDGSLRPDVDQRMHYQMPGAATSCPGNIKQFWDQFLLPYHQPYDPPVPPIESDEDMAVTAYIVQPPVEREGKPWLVVEGANVRPATSFDVTDAKYQIRRLTDQYRVDQYDFLYVSLFG